MAALLGALGEPAHVAVLAGGDEGREPRARASGPSSAAQKPDGVEAEREGLVAWIGLLRVSPGHDRRDTPGAGSRRPPAASPVCQNTSIGMPPRGYQ